MLNGSTLIKGRWKIVKKIGAGAFGEIYAGKNIISSQQVAIKVERADSTKQVLKLEVAVLKKVQPSPYVCRFVTCGRYGDYNYLVMELLGDNLSELRRRVPDGKFSMLTTLKLGIHFIRALESIHEYGFVHRDVKPSNFVIGPVPETAGSVFIIDFGLARRYVDQNGVIKASRDQSGFRGTARYASINSHLSKDLGRRDDLWSVFYILIEFASGNLPWRRLKDKEQIGQMKIKTNTPDLVSELPPEFLQFMQHLQALDYADRPDYDYLVSLLRSRLSRLGGTDETLYEWQTTQGATSSQRSIGWSKAPLQEVTQSRHLEDDAISSKKSANVDSPQLEQLSESSDDVHVVEPNAGGFGLPTVQRGHDDSMERETAPAARAVRTARPEQSLQTENLERLSTQPAVASVTGPVYKLVANKKLVTSASPEAPRQTGIKLDGKYDRRRNSISSEEETDDRAEQDSLDQGDNIDDESDDDGNDYNQEESDHKNHFMDDEHAGVALRRSGRPSASKAAGSDTPRRTDEDSLDEQKLDDSISEASVSTSRAPASSAKTDGTTRARRSQPSEKSACCAGCCTM